MKTGLYETIFLIGLVVASIIRTWYGIQFKRNVIVSKKKEHPIVYLGMTLWGIVLTLPLFYVFSSWLDFANYKIPHYLAWSGIVIFITGLCLLWRSHSDLEKNFSPSLLIRDQHTLVTTGVFKYIRHPMYLSFWCWAVGQALLIHNWVAGPTGIIAFYLIYHFRVPREEQQLVEYFGDAYRVYQRNTGKLFPVFNKFRSH